MPFDSTNPAHLATLRTEIETDPVGQGYRSPVDHLANGASADICLPEGRWYVAMTAINGAGDESVHSNEVIKFADSAPCGAIARPLPPVLLN